MKAVKLWVAVAISASVACDAAAADVTVIAAGGIEAALTQMAPGFERATGHKIVVSYSPGGVAKDKVQRGEAFDLLVAQSPYPEMRTSPNVDPHSETLLARVPLAIVVRQDTPKPDISTAAAVKKLLLAAKAVSYPNPASGADAGLSFHATLDKLGIAEQVKSKARLGEVHNRAMDILGRGEADVGLTYITEVVQPSVQIVGPLPADISTPTDLTAFIAAKAANPAGAKALVDYMTTPEAAAIYKSLRMTPGR